MLTPVIASLMLTYDASGMLPHAVVTDSMTVSLELVDLSSDDSLLSDAGSRSMLLNSLSDSTPAHGKSALRSRKDGLRRIISITNGRISSLVAGM